MLTVRCNCGETYQSEERHIGARLLCRKCGEIITILKSQPLETQTRSRWPDSPAERRSRFKLPVKWRLSYEDVSGFVATIKEYHSKIALVFGALMLLVALVALSTLKTGKLQPQGDLAAAQPSSTGATVGDRPPFSHLTPMSTPVPSGSGNPMTFPLPTATPWKEGWATPFPTIAPPAVPTVAPLTPLRRVPQGPSTELPNEEIVPPNPNTLPNGASPFGPGLGSGHCELTADNGTDTDALVRLISEPSGQLARNFYVSAGNAFTEKRVPPGNYVLRIALGKDWNESVRRFNYRRTFEETQPFDLTETANDYSVVTITLHAVLNGNFHMHPINEDQFWRR
jgi:hypothetical protein